MLREHEKTAVMSILVRVVECQDERERLEAELAEISERLTEVKALRSSATSALRVFGFDTMGDGLWDRVKEAIGADLYNQAFRIARPKPTVAPEEEKDSEEDDEEGSASSDKDDASTSTAEDDRDDASGDSESPEADTGRASIPVDQNGSVNIRELILQRLRDVGEEGARAADIREHVMSFGIDMHEKTVGMTLYRLKEAGLVKREGRTWFFADPAPKSSTEGQDDAQTSAVTLEKGVFE